LSIPRKLRCVVSSITDHGGGVYTVDLVPASPVPPFKPGQFLHLTVDDYDPSGFWPESRVFSIASSPRNRTHLRLCYSVKARYTTRMEHLLAPGREVWVKLPYGDFVIDDASDAVLIAGGTGISAFTAFLEALTPESKQKVTLIYGARNPELFLFQEMILSQLARVPGFNVIFFTETADASFAGRIATLPKPPQCFTGRITLSSVLRPLSSDTGPLTSDLRSLTSVLCPPSSVFYLSGPPIMLKALGEDLKSRGVPPDRIRTDAWE
jgi:ferredoxin-NADP reductase